MKINTKQDGSALTIAVEGRLDTNTSPELETIVKESLGDVTELTFDLAELSYISSAGLRVLLTAHKTMMDKGRMVVTNVTESVADIFEVTGFADILNIE